MSPSLKPNQEVLVDLKAYATKPPKAGDIVYVRHPLHSETLMFKRVKERSQNNIFTVLGDNPSQSTDSRQFGGVRTEHILGKVVCSFP